MRLRWNRPRWSLLVLLFAASVRLVGLNWDQNHHFHPDERAIASAIERISFAPLQLNPQFFAYGSFPFYVTRLVTSLLGSIQHWFAGYDGIILTGRALSALWGTGTVALLVYLGTLLYGRRAGLLAGFLLAATVLHVQNSHFAVNDVPLTFLVLLALTFLIRAVQTGRLVHFLAAGLSIGLAVATKFSALPILLPLAVAAFFRWRADGWKPRSLAYAFGAGALAAIGFFLGQPYAILDSRAYFHDILEQSRMVRNAGIFPYTNQYVGTPKYLYDVGQMVLWGMGPLLGIAAIVGTVRWLGRRIPKLDPSEWVLLSWVVPFFAVTASFDVKYLRYLLPIYPILILWGAAELDRWWSRTSVGRAAALAVAGGTTLWLFAFLAIYVRPHTVVTASEWFYSHVPAGTKVAIPHWEEGFPFPLPDRSPEQYSISQVPYYEEDNSGKIRQVSGELARAEYVVFPTKRIYGSVTRAAGKFPMTSPGLYRLFAGDLGYTLVRDFSSRPRLGGIEIPSELADESFSVYDHPRVLIFRNTGHLDAPEIERRILEGSPSRPMRRSDLLLARATLPAAGETVAQAAPSASPSAQARRVLPERTTAPGMALRSWGSALVWLLALLAVGAVTLPLCYLLFPNLADRGAGLAKILGLAAATWVLAMSVGAGLLRNGSGAATASFLLLAVAGAIAFVRHRLAIMSFWRERGRSLLAGEAAFALGFVLFLLLRALNPEIHWGEKPMDFSILNILVRSATLPPSDPWFAGAPLGYYVFGQQIVAFLTLLTGLSTRYTFNLAFGLLGGLVAQGAFSLARNWAGTRRAGWVGAGFTLLLGNLAGLREILVNHRPLDWHYFWATSRVIPDTINEYPFWSLLFADLHAHVLSLPLFLLVLASALQLLRAHTDPSAGVKRRVTSALVLGFAVTAQALTNAWDIPLLAGIVLLTTIVAAMANPPLSRAAVGRALVSLAIASVSPIVFGRALWVRGGGLPGLGWNAERGARGVDFLTHFGFFLFLAFAWLATSIASRIPRTEERSGSLLRGLVYAGAALVLDGGFLSVDFLCVAGILLFLFALFAIAERPEERLACGLIAAALFLVLLPQRAYIYDRMNTFFKLYFEAWSIFALSSAVLVFAAASRGSFDRWPRVLRGLFFVLLAAAVFTSVTAARGDLFGEGNPSRPVEPSGLSLDGLRHLEKWRSGEYLAIEWLRREVPGTPVILEAQGASYQDFSRVSMLTGMPTVLGWEHHVKQRGNPESEVVQRRAHIQQIYSSPKTDGIRELLRRYHVGYVYLGELEKRTYPAEGLKKFAEATDLFQLVYENPGVRIYRVVGGDSEDVISPVRETLPVAEAPRGAREDEPEEAPAIRETPAEGVPPFSGLKEPRDAAIDDSGRLWIADFGNSRLRIFLPDGGFLGGWGGRGSGNFGLKEPCAVAVSGSDVYIADTWNGRVQHFTTSGEWKGTVGELYGPRGIAVAPDGSVWVADTGNKRLAVFDRDLKPARIVGKLGSGPLEFSEPVGLAFGPTGMLYVADAGNSRIQILDAKGGFLRAIAVPTWDRNLEPHLEIDDDQTIYASDPKGSSLLVISPSGQLSERRTTGDTGQPLARPTGVAIDRKNRILYVVNSGSNTISKWSLAEKGKP